MELSRFPQVLALLRKSTRDTRQHNETTSGGSSINIRNNTSTTMSNQMVSNPRFQVLSWPKVD